MHSQTIKHIKERLDEVQKGLNRFSYWFKNDPAKIRRWEQDGLDIYNLKNLKDRSRATRIVFMKSREAKLPSYEDHYDVIEEDLIAEKEAKYELEGMRRKTIEKKNSMKYFVGESICQLSNSMNKSNLEIGQSYQQGLSQRRDTRESQECVHQNQSQNQNQNVLRNVINEPMKLNNRLHEKSIKMETPKLIQNQQEQNLEEENISKSSRKESNIEQSREEDMSLMRRELEELRKSNLELQHKIMKMSEVSAPFEVNLKEHGLEKVYEEKRKESINNINNLNNDLRQPLPQ